MGAKRFICPNGDKVLIGECLKNCPQNVRCMGRPTLENLAQNCRDRGLNKFSVTELIRGTRESYLLKIMDYDVDPQSMIFAAHGTAIHKINEENSKGIISELRLENEIATGQIDAYGDSLGTGENILLDYKVTSSFKARKALGFYQVDVPTGEVYKTGAKKGQPKYKKEWRMGGTRSVFEWALQLNFYRMLLEENGYVVDGMYIQMYIRNFSKAAGENNITRPIYIIRINKISDAWIRRWFKAKLDRLEKALQENRLPGPCKKRETWNGNKCQGYCNVAEYCDVAWSCQREDSIA